MNVYERIADEVFMRNFLPLCATVRLSELLLRIADFEIGLCAM